MKPFDPHKAAATIQLILSRAPHISSDEMLFGILFRCDKEAFIGQGYSISTFTWTKGEFFPIPAQWQIDQVTTILES